MAEVKPKLHTGPNGERLVETPRYCQPNEGDWYLIGTMPVLALEDHAVDAPVRQILRPALPSEAEAAEREPTRPLIRCSYCDTEEECKAVGKCLSNIHDEPTPPVSLSGVREPQVSPPAGIFGFSDKRCTLCGCARLTNGTCSFIECKDPLHDWRKENEPAPSAPPPSPQCIACQVEHSLEILKTAQPPDAEALDLEIAVAAYDIVMPIQDQHIEQFEALQTAILDVLRGDSPGRKD